MTSRSLLALFAAFSILLTSPWLHAGTDIQGTDIQGTDIQGTDIQGTDIQGTDIQGTDIQGTDIQGTDIQGSGVRGTKPAETWLQGMSLTGIARGARRSAARLIDVVSFHGDVIDAFLWSARAGWRRTTLRPGDLAGVEWQEHRCDRKDRCSSVRYRIVDAIRDRSRNTMPRHGDNGDIWLYRVEYTTAENPTERDWKNVCPRQGHRRAKGMFVSGRWDQDGSWRPGGYTFSCTRGVVAKCARSWGYKPWKRLLAGTHNIDLRPLHQACTRAARADYCGDGDSHTRDGTLIDMFDIYGFNVRQPGTGFTKEAGFAESGAQWVARTRWPTGRPKKGPRLTLPGCRRPTKAPEDDPSTIRVWSSESPLP